MVRTADSSVWRCAVGIVSRVRAAVMAGMMEMVMGVMNEQGRLKIVWQKL